MTKLTVDSDTETKLRDLRESVELCGQSGRVLGYFTPASERALYEGVQSPTSADELLQRAQEGGGRPLSEIFANLRARA